MKPIRRLLTVCILLTITGIFIIFLLPASLFFGYVYQNLEKIPVNVYSLSGKLIDGKIIISYNELPVEISWQYCPFRALSLTNICWQATGYKLDLAGEVNFPFSAENLSLKNITGNLDIPTWSGLFAKYANSFNFGKLSIDQGFLSFDSSQQLQKIQGQLNCNNCQFSKLPIPFSINGELSTTNTATTSAQTIQYTFDGAVEKAGTIQGSLLFLINPPRMQVEIQHIPLPESIWTKYLPILMQKKENGSYTLSGSYPL